jgi:predicted transposase YbfD/YdcC
MEKERSTDREEEEVLRRRSLLITIEHVEANIKAAGICCECCCRELRKTEKEESLEVDVEVGLLDGNHLRLEMLLNLGLSRRKQR